MATNPQSTGRSLLSPVFVITAALLLVAAFGLRPTIGALIRHYSKEPIDLRRSLDELDSARLPSFRHRPDRAGVPELTDADGIGTDDWIDMVFQERYPEDEAGRSHMLLLLVTYYSDPRDQVAHTPEVCYRQGGAVVDEIDTVSVETPGLGPQTLKVDARRLVIDQGGRKKILLYVFCCNGEFYNDREQVRFAIGWPICYR